MLKLKSAVWAWSALVISSQAMAAVPGITLGSNVGYAGTGCPAGSASVTLSPDKKELSVLFDSYSAEAIGSKTVDRKTCNLAIPVRVPQGYQVSLLTLDYRGYASIPQGASAQLSAEYFFAGSRGPRSLKNFRGGFEDEYLHRDALIATTLVWSSCGAETVLRVNSAMTARTNAWGEQTLATVDSIDAKAAMIFGIQWRQCR